MIPGTTSRRTAAATPARNEATCQLLKEAQEVKFGDKFGLLDEDDLEDEDYECIITDLEESLIFRDVMGEMAAKHPDLYGTVRPAASTPPTSRVHDAPFLPCPAGRCMIISEWALTPGVSPGDVVTDQ